MKKSFFTEESQEKAQKLGGLRFFSLVCQPVIRERSAQGLRNNDRRRSPSHTE
jgi:hypothetical protein